jgi:hypothetical protein
MKKQILILSALLFSSLLQAQDLQTSVEKKPAAAPAWKAGLTTYYYNFEGTHDSTKAEYSFDKAILNMQIATVQYQINPKWTFQLLTQYLDNYVETKMFGTVYKDRTKGFGDVIGSFITPLAASSEYVVLADLGASLPTGNINQENAYVPGQHYAYNMQNGSGTVDAVTGLTALSFQGPMQLGSHLTGIFRNGRNENGYALGNLYRADVWADYNTASGVTPRIVGYYKYKDAIQGRDEEYEKNRDVVGGFYEFYHHAQINWDLSAALKYAHSLGAVTVAAEAGVPFAQNSNNYDEAVVSTRYYGNLSVSGSF